MRSPPPSFARWVAVAILVILADQLTKWLIRVGLADGTAVEVAPFLKLVLVYNTGAAFSLLADAGGWQRLFFAAFATIVSGIILRLLWRHSDMPFFSFALSLVLGGAVGNLIDRLWLGRVVDFLYFHVQSWYWPAFNVADSAITVGVALLILDSLRKPRAARTEE